MLALVLAVLTAPSAAPPPAGLTPEDCRQALIKLGNLSMPDSREIRTRQQALSAAKPETGDGVTVKLDVFECNLRHKSFAALIENRYFDMLEKAYVAGFFTRDPRGGWRAYVAIRSCFVSESKP